MCCAAFLPKQFTYLESLSWNRPDMTDSGLTWGVCWLAVAIFSANSTNFSSLTVEFNPIILRKRIYIYPHNTMLCDTQILLTLTDYGTLTHQKRCQYTCRLVKHSFAIYLFICIGSVSAWMNFWWVLFCSSSIFDLNRASIPIKLGYATKVHYNTM